MLCFFRMILLFACAGAAPESPDAPVQGPRGSATVAPPASTNDFTNGRIKVGLRQNVPTPIPGIAATVTLLSSVNTLAMDGENRRMEITSGSLRIANDAEDVEVQFVAGQGFRAIGRRFVVQGDAGSLSLVIQALDGPARP